MKRHAVQFERICDADDAVKYLDELPFTARRDPHEPANER